MSNMAQSVRTDENSSREASEEPPSFDDRDMDAEDDPMEETFESDFAPSVQDGPDADDVFHPLRETAERVGREVELFARALDKFNPLKAADADAKYETALSLIDAYEGIAKQNVDNLRQKHGHERPRRGQKKGGDEAMDVDEDVDMGMSIMAPKEDKTTVGDLDRWEQELQTWKLFRQLVNHRHKAPGSSKAIGRPKQRLNDYTPEHEVWQSFLESNDLALERRTVLKWLNQCADENGEDIDELVKELQQNADRGDIIAHGWIHTKAAIKNQKRVHAWPCALDESSPEVQRVHYNSAKTEPLICHLDPDATTREGRKLEAQDEYFERAIWLGCYELLRRGKSSQEIQEWCQERTEIWRSVSLSNFPDTENSADEGELQDPRTGILWRRMCFAAARKGDQGDFQKAVYGLLCGDIDSVDPVCKTWDDSLYMHYNALLKSQYDEYLRFHYPSYASAEITQAFSTFDAVQFHGEPKYAGRRIIESLKMNPKTRKESKIDLKMIQGVLIADDFESFIYQQGLAISKSATAETANMLIPDLGKAPERADINAYITHKDYDGLRMLSHMIIIYRLLGAELGRTSVDESFAIDNVIVAYMLFLQLAAKEDTLPLYAALLSEDRAHAALCRLSLGIVETEDRLKHLKLMQQYGLDVQRFVQFQTIYLMSDNAAEYKEAPKADISLVVKTESSGHEKYKLDPYFLGPEIKEIDEALATYLEWHLLVDGLWSDTFRTGVMMYTEFFGKFSEPSCISQSNVLPEKRRIAAAIGLMKSVPCTEIVERKTKSILGETKTLEGLHAGAEGYPYDQDMDDLSEEDAENRRLLMRHMLQETKIYHDLETLAEVFELMVEINEQFLLMRDANS